MEVSEEKLVLHGIISYLNRIYDMGELVEDSDSIRGAIRYLKESQKNDGLENIIINWDWGLKKLRFNKEVREKIKKSLNNLFLNLNLIENTLGNIPIEERKNILGFVSSCIGIYYINEEGWKDKDKFEILRELIPFKEDGKLKDLKWILGKNNRTVEEVFENIQKDSDTVLRLGMILKKINEDGYNDNELNENNLDESESKEEWMKIWQEVFFRRVQWKIWKKLQEKNFFTGKQILKLLTVFEKITKKFEEVEDGGEFINIIFDVIMDEYNLRGTEIEEKVNTIKPILYKHVTDQINMSEEQAKDILRSYPTLKEIKDSIDIEKLSKEEVHITLMEYQNEYNKIKISYDLKAHKELREKVKRYMKDENTYISLYVAYFLIDSQALIDNKIAALREIKKTKTKVKELKKFKESLEKLRSYKIEEDYWNGREIEYIDFLARLCFLVADNENEIYVLNPQMMIKICGKLLSKEGKKVITDKLDNLKKITLPQVEVGYEG